MKTLYGQLKVLNLLKLPALIFFLLAFSYYASGQSSNSPVCYGSSIKLYLAGGTVSTVGAVSYAWIGNSPNTAGWSSVDKDPVIPFGTTPGYFGTSTTTTVGQYAVTVYYADLHSEFGTVNVAVIPPPNPTIMGGAATVCYQSTVTKTYTTELGMSTYSWTVTGGSIVSGSTSSTVVVDWSGASVGPQTMTLIVTSSTCTVTTTKTVTVQALPVVAISGTTSVCINSTKTYSLNITPSATAGAAYVWTTTGTGGASSTNTTYSVTWPVAGAKSVSVTYTDALGCVASAMSNVTVEASPVVTGIAGTYSICTAGSQLYTATTIAGASYAWASTLGTVGTSTTTTNTVTFSGTTGGTGSITVIATSALGCPSAVYTQSIAYYPVVITPPISGPTAICVPGTATSTYSVTATNATAYAWTISGSGDAIASSGNPAIATWNLTAGTGTVTVTASNANGCQSSATLAYTKTITPAPTVVAASGTFTVCNNTCASYYVSMPVAPVYAHTVYTYNWVVTSTSGGHTITGQGTSSITVCWGAAGTGTVQVTVTADGCSGSSPLQTVVIGASYTLPAITGPVSVCNFTGAPVNPGNHWYYINDAVNYDTYEWTISGPSTSTITYGASTKSSTVYWGGPGVYNASVNIVTTKNGCTDNKTLAVTVLGATATPTLNGTFSVCPSSTTKVSYTTDAGKYFYNWSVLGGAASGTTTASTVNIIWANGGVTGTVTVQYAADPAGFCTASNTKTVVVGALPGQPGITATPSAASVCVNTSVEYRVTTPVTGETYYWSINKNGTVTTMNDTRTITVTYTAAGTGTITVYAKSALLCQGPTATTTTIVNPLSAPTFVLPSPGISSSCVGNSVTYQTQSGKLDYLWTVSNQSGVVTTTSGNYQLTTTFNEAGIWTIAVNYTEPGTLCRGTGVQTIVTVYDRPVPTINSVSGDWVACPGETEIYYTESDMTGYTWNVTGGTATWTANAQTVTVTWNDVAPWNGYTGTLSINYTENGCNAVTATTQNVMVSSNPVPVVNVYTANDWLVCQSSGNHVYYTAPVTGANYSWVYDGPNGTSITNGATTSQVTVFWGAVPDGQTATGTISVQVTNAIGCVKASILYYVTIKGLPIIAAPSGATVVCVSMTNSDQYTYTTVSGMYNYKWTVSSGGVATWTGSLSNSINVIWNTAGDKTVSVIYSNVPGNTCSPTTGGTLNVKVNARPAATFVSPAQLVCASNSLVRYETQSGKLNYVWANVNGATVTPSVTTNTHEIWLSWPTAGTQSISVSYTDPTTGCAQTATTKIPVNVQAVPVVPVILGTDELCIGTSAKYTLQTVVTGYTYNWVVTGGTPASGSGTSITVTWTGSAGTIQVTAINSLTAAQCSTTSLVKNIIINPLATPTIVSNDWTVCQNTYGHEYYNPEPPVLNSYTWVITGDGIITAGQYTNSVTVSWGNPGYGTLTVFAKTDKGCQGSSGTQNVTIQSNTVTPTISGTTTVCSESELIYETQAGMTGYTWTVYGGVYTTTGVLANQILVTWGAGPTGYVEVSYTGACLSSSSAQLAVVINPLPTPVIIPSVPPIVCQNSTGNHYSTTAVTGNVYEWAISTTGIITAGANTNQATVTWIGTPYGYMQVTETILATGCFKTVGGPGVYTVTINPLPTPVVTGNTTPILGQSYVYTTPPSGNLYTWEVIGGSITSGNGTSTITVLWTSAGAGSVKVIEDNSYCQASFTLPVNVSTGSLNLSGTIVYDNCNNPAPFNYCTPLNGVTVQLKSGATVVGTTTTGASGNYAFNNISSGVYTLNCITTKPWAGVNATDALLCQLHPTVFYPPYGASTNGWTTLRNWAGDVNLMNGVNATDAGAIKERVVGTTTSFPAGDWKFGVGTVTSTTAAAALTLTQTTVYNFNGICVGDVNASNVPGSAKSASMINMVDDGTQYVAEGQIFNYSVRANNYAEVGAMTLFMNFDQELISVENVESTEGMQFNLGNGQISMAWSDLNARNLYENDAVINLTLKAKKAIENPARIFAITEGTEFADANAQPISNFNLKFAKIATSGSEFTMNNYPNPFKSTTEIVYTLPENATVKLVVTNMFGQTLKTLVNEIQSAGSHKVTVDAQDLNLKPGVYMYKIEVTGANSNFVKTNKMTFTR